MRIIEQLNFLNQLIYFVHCNEIKVRKTELLSGLKIVECSSFFYPRRPASKFQKFWAKNKTEVECLLSHFGTFRIYSHLWGRAAGVGCRSPLFGCLLFSMKLIIVSHRSHLSVWQRPVFNGKFDNDERQLLPKKTKISPDSEMSCCCWALGFLTGRHLIQTP